MVEHTPCPWSVSAKPSSVVGWPVCGELGSIIADVCTLTVPGVPVPKEAYANARLIAAAPDLLGALETVMREFFPHPTPDEYPELRDARAAIAKATGLARTDQEPAHG